MCILKLFKLSKYNNYVIIPSKLCYFISVTTFLTMKGVIYFPLLFVVFYVFVSFLSVFCVNA